MTQEVDRVEAAIAEALKAGVHAVEIPRMNRKTGKPKRRCHPRDVLLHAIDYIRFELQKQGYVAAFRNPRVLRAIRSGANQAIAVTMAIQPFGFTH